MTTTLKRHFMTSAMASVALAGLSQMAVAADMPVKARPIASCGAQFAGSYLGANAGAVAFTALRHDQNGLLIDNESLSATRIGGTIGVQAGYDWQSCNRLVGIAADWNWAGANGSTRIDPNTVGADLSMAARLNWFSTVRARAGLVVDNSLFYVTGGLAFGRVRSTYTDNFAAIFQQSVTGTRTGLALGFGTETTLASNWTVNTEVMHLRFAKTGETITAALFNPSDIHYETADSAWIARAGLNYRFGGVAPATKPYVYSNGNVAQFAGGYVGVNGASVSYTGVRHDQDSFLIDNGEYSVTKLGYGGGVQAGYDWQSGARVWGIVGDINYSGAKAKTFLNPSSNPGFGGEQSITGKLGWYGTLRGRAGLAANDSLIYVTGGLAGASITTRIVENFPGLTQDFSQTRTRWGWTGGVGTESALPWAGWSLSSELLYMQFAKNNFVFFVPNNGANSQFENNDSVWVSRIGLNYRGGMFGATGKPYTGPARFAGLYVGGTLGAIGYSALRADQDSYITDNDEYTATKFGVTGGVQAGYDWQWGTKLFGVVGDINWGDTKTRTQINPNRQVFGIIDQSVGGKINWYSTLRTRSGVAVDDVLVYVTGGIAVAGINTTINDILTGGSETLSATKTRFGWTGGAGAEFLLGSNWSVTSEALYMQFKPSNTVFASAPGFQNRNVSFENHDSAWIARMGVNYRFGGPVVSSRY